MKAFGAKISETQVASQLRSTLGENEVAELTVDTVEKMIRKVYADEFDPKNKKFWKPRLTWTEAENRDKAMPEDMIGEWNTRRPSVWPTNKAWVVQNCKLMSSAGRPITLEDLSDSKKTWVTKDGTPHVAPSDREGARLALETYRKLAIENDPLFCEYCEENAYRAKDWNDRTKHIYQNHPVVFAGMVGVKLEKPAPIVSAIPDVEKTEVAADGALICCGKTYSSVGRVNQHRSVSKAHRV